MKKVKILDCTLRDGGYYNNWDFDESVVNLYCDFVEKAPIDYVEVGYRSITLEGYFGEYFYCPIYVLERLKKRMPSKELVIILNEKDIRAEHVEDLLSECQDLISMVRIAVDPKNFRRAIILAKKVKSLKFKVAFNVMYMSNWKHDSSFLEDLKEIESVVDYFYMVDSFGGVMIEDVVQTIDLVKNKSDNIALGFHGHNNLQMAMANTLEAINRGCVIVDGTITGMGRGAGNLRMELFLTYLESKGYFEIDYSSLGNIVSKFEKMKDEYKWGTNLPYMFSGAYSLGQKQVMDWVGLNRYSISSILNALKNKKEFKKDNFRLNNLAISKSCNRSLIIGGGESIAIHETAIVKLLQNEPDLTLIHAGARNINKFLKLKNKQYYSLVGSESNKLTNSIKDFSNLKGTCVYPPFPRKMGTQIPNEQIDNSYELNSINFTSVSEDSPLALSIQTAIDIGVEKIFFVGFDGYKNKINSNQLLITKENQKILDDLNKLTNIDSLFLLPTEYKNVKLSSLYNYI